MLILSVIFFFIIGFVYELEYRVLTRTAVKYFANFKIGYYGGKGLRIFETDIAFILTLLPISFSILIRKLNSFPAKLILAIQYLICIPAFYCLYCFMESEFIAVTTTLSRYVDGVFMYHSNNINYRSILFLTVTSTFAIGIITGKLIKKAGL